MSCCQNIKAYVGFTQDHEWYVVMVANEKIACECHPIVSFCLKPPFSLERWKQAWDSCLGKFFHDPTVQVAWQTDLSALLWDKTHKIVIGIKKTNNMI